MSCKREKTETIKEETEIEIVKDSLKEIEITILDTIKTKIPQQLLASIENDYQGKQYKIINFNLGFIDNNETEDAVVIIQENDKSSGISESILVYQNTKDRYLLMAQNRSIITQEYYFTDEHTNSSKEIEIEEHHIKVSLFCYGPCGNTFLDFKFENDTIFLSKFSTYDVGAGAEIEREYDIEKNLVKIAMTNTMTDGMEVTEEEFTFTYSKGIRFIDLNTKDLFKELGNLESKIII